MLLCALGIGVVTLPFPPTAAAASASEQSTARLGTIEGRVLNDSSGNYLNNARVTVAGTSLETNTDATGFFRLTNVPEGNRQVTVQFVDLSAETATVTVLASGVVTQNFAMRLGDATHPDDKVLQLDAFTVTERQLSGQASALQEQKNAPNIKNVISFDEFGSMGEGNIAEYLKFVPGLDIAYSPGQPVNVSIRGMPPSGTLITLDGATTATTNTGVTRNYDVSIWSTANIDRVEITKTPTPDLPANAVGGSINIITKTGFSVAKPSFKYNLFLTHDELGGISEFDPTFSKIAGPNAIVTKRKMRPSYTLQYVQPINEKFAFTLGNSHSERLTDQIIIRPSWDRVRLVQTANSANTIMNFPVRNSYSGSLDWRLSRNDLLTFSAQRNTSDTQSHGSSFAANLGAGNTGDSTFSQGAATGVGTVTRNYTVNDQVKVADVFSLRYKHDGPVWKYNGMVTYSEGNYTASPDGSYFTGASTTNSLSGNLIIRFDNMGAINDQRNPVYTATNRAGQPVDIFTGDTLGVTATTIATNIRDNSALNAGFNVERKFDFKVPTVLKMGVLVDSQERMVSNDLQSFTFNPPGGTPGRSVTNYDVLATEYGNRGVAVDANGARQKIMHISMQKLYGLYLKNPEWFALNDVTRHTTWVNNRRDLKETISAGYIRGDVRLFDNRMWIIGGVRYEHTNDKGAGPKDDISAIYVKNADGSFARTPGGALIPITTNALEQAKLRYVALGTVSKKNYDGFYPSLNASYEVNQNVVLRAAYARTIGRPELIEIIPGATVAQPDGTDEARTITVNNSALNPWTADNFDATVEVYGFKGASASISVFQKDVTGFFASTSAPATRELVESYGVTWEDIYSNYTVLSKRNAGSATLQGFEMSYRQTLQFLPGWGKRFQIFANLTNMTVSGPDAASFNFSPMRYNWGVGYYGKKFIANINVSNGKPLRQAAVETSASVKPNTYDYRLDYPRCDVSLEYNFTKRLGVFASVRNLNGNATRYYTYAPDTPDYARPDQFQFAGSLISMGIKGEW